MTTEALFRTEPYLKTARAEIIARTEEGGVVVDRSIFYPRGGGQPGDSGRITWDGGTADIASTVKTPDGQGIVLVPAEPAPMPYEGTEIEMMIDWDRRHRYMRMHTALHLLSVVVPLPVTGGQIGAEKSRLDFEMPEVIYDREFLQAKMNGLIAADHPVTDDLITEAELDANPGLVKTLSVQPPRGAGTIRLVRIGAGDTPVDLQPCGGTHVASTAEIGAVTVGKIENKGKSNRRISLLLEG
ncbi:Ala-tRNA(Pro) hydrolase [Jannaschia pagri]|uniref:Alanine--tRNA ligase n=1 Tax=Jannaschia pagri TaxID=2829797 RepID=A0ABQ4NMY6_9RHOB|nr:MULTISPECIES: alanyl-tRNA editing protein [unclassified Jannaschia]GIT91915.1 Ala-tRNA(Pro) hydrolase [Jannaschia sp. AI_61]GIT95749.1 Ala-tRNA(Pro) hydrolase [Jannaschia sp. AI_62]